MKAQTETNLKVGDKLYYSDTKTYAGEVVKVLKRDIHFKRADGTIQKGYPISLCNGFLINIQ